MLPYPSIVIKESYNTYQTLLQGHKNTVSKRIVLENTGNNKNYAEQTAKVIHNEFESHELRLVVRVSMYDSERFEFKLLCQGYYPEPIFRFETDGATHRNLHIPLKVQAVPPPHFHKFHESGYNIAYKTPQLEEKNSADALKDVTLCIHHFCHEGNLRYNNNDFPEISFAIAAIPFPNTHKQDPLEAFEF